VASVVRGQFQQLHHRAQPSPSATPTAPLHKQISGRAKHHLTIRNKGKKMRNTGGGGLS